MTATPRFNWNTWATGQAQPNQPFNTQLADMQQLVGLTVISRSTTAQPGSPTNGDAYIIPSGATGAAWSTFSAGDVAHYWDDGTNASWVAIGPETGLLALVADEGGILQYDGAAWSGIPQASKEDTTTAYELELGDGTVRMNNAAANVVTIPANASVAFPIGTRIRVYQIGAGATTIAITTDTLLGVNSISTQNGWVDLEKIAATTWIGIN